MALLYGYGTGSVIESFRYDQIADLLNKIPNNTNNLIKSEDVRDSIFTLWERVSELSVNTSSYSVTYSTFLNTNPTTVTVGGVNSGTTFPTSQTIQQMFDAIFYPYVGPTISLNVVGSISSTIPISINKEYGQSLTSVLYWSVVKRSNSILSININGTNIGGITGNSQVGWRVVSGTYSFPLPVSTSNSFPMQVFDGTATASTSTTVNWMNRIYWGSIDLSAITYPNPDLTLNPSYITYVSPEITSNLIKSLNGSGVGSGSELSTTKNKTYNGINTNGKYLIFAWPSSVSGSTSPTFTVNGLANTAFTLAKTSWAFTNTYNVVTNYEVWVSNTAYNSPANIIIS